MKNKSGLFVCVLFSLQACQGQNLPSSQTQNPLVESSPVSSPSIPLPTPTPAIPTSTPQPTWSELEQQAMKNCPGYATLSEYQMNPVWLKNSDWLLFTHAVSSVLSYAGIQCGNSSSGVSSTYTLLNLKTGQSQPLPVGTNNSAPLISPSGRYLIAQNHEGTNRITRLIEISPVYQEKEIPLASINTYPIAFADEQHFLTLTQIDSQYQNLDSVLITNPADIQHLFKLPRGPELGIWVEKSKRFLKAEKNYPSDPSSSSNPWQVTLLLKLDDPSTQNSRLLWQQSEPSTSTIEGLSVSPDQKYAAFWLQRTSGTDQSTEQSKVNAQAILVNLESGQIQTFFESSAPGKSFGWSQDSQQLAFGAKGFDDAHSQIYSLNLQRTNSSAKPYLKLAGRDLHSPVWSPDTQQMVAFAGSAASYANPPTFEQQDGLYLFNLPSGSVARQLTCGSYDRRDSYQDYLQKPFTQASWPCAK